MWKTEKLKSKKADTLTSIEQRRKTCKNGSVSKFGGSLDPLLANASMVAYLQLTIDL